MTTLLLALSCVPEAGQAFGLSRADEPANTLVFNNATEPEYLDPTLATGHPDGRIIGELFDGLTEYDPQDLSPRPSLAESWEVHPDGRGYTFHLRQDAVWSDGEPVTAEDVLWSWEKVLNPVFLGRYAQQLYLVQRAPGYNTNRVFLDDSGQAWRAESSNVWMVDGQAVTGSADGEVLRFQTRDSCPDLNDLAALLDCPDPWIQDKVPLDQAEPSFPLPMQRVLSAAAQLQGAQTTELSRGDEVTLLKLEDGRAKVYYAQQEKTGWLDPSVLADPRGEIVEYQLVQLPDIDWEQEHPLDAAEEDSAEAVPIALAPPEPAPAPVTKKLSQLTVTPELLGLRADDAHTLVVRLSGVAPYFLQLTSHTTLRPSPPQGWETHGPAWTRPEHIVTSGPYLLREHEVRDKFVLEKNPDWWGAKDISIEHIVAYSIDNLHTSANLYRAGYTDLVVANDIPAEFMPILHEAPDFEVSPALSVYVYRINTTKPPFDDPRIRRALAMAIDKDDIVQVLKAGQMPADHIVPPGLPGYEGAPGPGFDPEAARALLAEAGYPDGEGLPPVKILYNTLESHKLVAAIVQDNWAKHLGVTVELENREWKTYLKAVNGLDYDIARGGWIGDYLDPLTFLELWMTNGGNNNTGWASAEYDALILASGQEPDPARRAEILLQAEAMLNEEMPFIPIYWYVWAELTQPTVQGTHPNLLDQHPIRYMSLDR